MGGIDEKEKIKFIPRMPATFNIVDTLIKEAVAKNCKMIAESYQSRKIAPITKAMSKILAQIIKRTGQQYFI